MICHPFFVFPFTYIYLHIILRKWRRAPFNRTPPCGGEEIALSIEIDPDLCIACGVCEDICGEVFAVEGNLAVAEHPENCEEAACCEDAAEACPTDAIIIPE